MSAEPNVEPERLAESRGFQVSRRGMLAGSGAALAALGLAGAGGFGYGHHRGEAAGRADSDVMQVSYPMRARHQPGILTPQQQQMHTAAYDVTAKTREGVIQLLKDWSLAAERMMAGDLVGDYKTFRDVPPDDTGETGDLGPAALTILIGFGATLFRSTAGVDRFGLASKLPRSLAEGIPRMAAEKIDPAASNGDLIVQACAEDPMVAMHAIHNMTRVAFGSARLRWSQLGYGRTSSTSTGQATPRNLFGFKDGTANIKAEDSSTELNAHLWIQPADEAGAWASGGTYMCIRKIKQMMEVWDELVLSEQELIVGRDKIHGAPLSGGTEFTDPDFAKTGPDGTRLVDPASHVAKVHPSHHKGRRMLRRGYNYMEGNDPLGRLQGGLFFIAFVRDPKTHFVPVLRAMRDDRMTEYLQHLSSSVFLIPPGLGTSDDYVGQALFET